MTEQEIRRLLGQDLSLGTEAFRDELLARCLEALDEGEAHSPRPALGRAYGELLEFELSDDRLDLLAAAGEMKPSGDPGPVGGGVDALC